MVRFPWWLPRWLANLLWRLEFYRAWDCKREHAFIVGRYGYPRDHAAFAEKHGLRGMERELKMTRAQLEDLILRRANWQTGIPWFDAFDGACALAAFGELYGPESRIGQTRKAALRTLRRRLNSLLMAEVEVILVDYEASGPHPKHEFGPGWTGADELQDAYARYERRVGDDLSRVVEQCEDAIAGSKVGLPERLSNLRRRTKYALFAPVRALAGLRYEHSIPPPTSPR